MKVQNLNPWPVDTPTGLVAPGAIVEADEVSPHLSEVKDESEAKAKTRKTAKTSQEGST